MAVGLSGKQVLFILSQLLPIVIVSVRGQTTQNINILFVNEVDNNLANVAVEVALNYVKKNPQLGLSVDMMYVEGNRTDSKDLL
uniref:Receptor ligand binding region domain-containing protein n=1 Tax=Anopheles atroparvus TaxID=41427 RepID=A0AAG5D0P1_ANOAO